MMMCVGSVSDFEAQMAVTTERFAGNGTAEDRELSLRSTDWLYDRRADSSFGVFQTPVEPSRPYSHGRRFIPAWLAAERERCMAGPTWGPTYHKLFGCTLSDMDDSILVMYEGVIIRRSALT